MNKNTGGFGMNNIKIMEDFHFNCLQGMYFTKIKPFEQGVFLSSDIIDESYYNYMALVKTNSTSLNELLKQAMDYFSPLERTTSLYITPSSDLYCSTIDIPNLQKQYTDAWMVLDSSEILCSYVADKRISISKVDSQSEFSIFVETFYEAYSGDNPDDPYANLSPTYVQSLRNSYSLTDNFGRHHYLARLDGIPVGVATAIESEGVVAIYNVGTVTKYRKSGIGKAVMSKITQDFLDSNLIFLQTEYGSYVERWYESMGYKTVFLGECYSIT